MAAKIAAAVREYVTREGTQVTPELGALLAGRAQFRLTDEGFALGDWRFLPRGRMLVRSYWPKGYEGGHRFWVEVISLRIEGGTVTVQEIVRGTWEVKPEDESHMGF